PFERPDRLVTVWESSPHTGKPNVINPTNFSEWRARNRSFERMAAYIGWTASLTGMGGPEVVPNAYVTPDFFPILNVKPVLGRWFAEEEGTANRKNVVMVSESLWRRRFGARPDIVGQKLLVDNNPETIVGVMPAGFRFPQVRAEIWEPLTITRGRVSHGRSLN